MMKIYGEDNVYEVPNADGFQIERDGILKIQDNNYDTIVVASLKSVDVAGANDEVVKVDGNSNQ